MKPKRLIVFDMDGVIIDVSGSYRETVRRTARLFFKGARSWETLPDPLFSQVDLARLKQSGGLNNDWDLTCAVLGLLFKCVSDGTDPTAKASPMGLAELSSHWDAAPLARHLTSVSTPLAALMTQSPTAHDPVISGFYKGDVGSGNIIKQIFQEIYLGKDLFYTTYGFPAEFYVGQGLIDQEKPLADPGQFNRLANKHVLAIATGRPLAEAEYALNRYRLGTYFDQVVTLDHCLVEENRIREATGRAASLSKPHPYMLDAIAGQVAWQGAGAPVYIGDMPDDMVAAGRSRAGYIGIGAVMATLDRDRLRKDLLRAGARHIIENLDELEKLMERI